MIERYLQRTKQRMAWEGYVLSTRLRRKAWDLLRSDQLPGNLADACIFDEHLPTYFPKDESIRNNPFICQDILDKRRTYLYHFQQQVLLEPCFGYVIAEPNSIIDLSLPGCELARAKVTMHFFSGVPSLQEVFAARNGSRPIRKEPVVASLRFVFDDNYYHFFHDVMSKLKILDDYGVNQSVPLVISPQLARQPFFQRMRKQGDLAKRNWLIQDNFYIHADEVIFAQPDVGNRTHLDHFLTCANAPAADTTYHRQIFLTRDPSSGRNIVNMHELIPILEEFDFEIIDTAQMTVEEQMVTFSQTDYLIAIHGAGLTNMLFRRDGSMRILEIFPPYAMPFCFYELAEMYDFEYSHITGHNPLGTNRHSAFYVDPEQFRRELYNSIGLSVY